MDTDVHNEEGQGYKSIMTINVVHQVDHFVRENRRFTISNLATRFSKISVTTLYRIISENLGYQKFCAYWVPKQLTDVHKTQLVNFSNIKMDEEFLQQIVTGDENWVQYVNLKSKEHSKQRMHTTLIPNKRTKFQVTFSHRKNLRPNFGIVKAYLMIEFKEPLNKCSGLLWNSTEVEKRNPEQNKECLPKVWCFCMTMHNHTLLHTQKLKWRSSIGIYLITLPTVMIWHQVIITILYNWNHPLHLNILKVMRNL